MTKSNLQSRKAAIFGGSGFVGRCLVNRLISEGYVVSVITRKNVIDRKHKADGASYIQYCINDNIKIDEIIRGHDVVINLVGILHETNSNTFKSIHIDFPVALVRACETAGVENFLHISALNADMRNLPSKYLRSKSEGELMILENAKKLKVSIFRPSIIFGEGDNFIGQFSRLLRWNPIFPVVCPNTKFAPVWVEDVASALFAVIDKSYEPSSNRAFNLCGPNVYSFRQLIEFTTAAMNVNRMIINVPDWAARFQGIVMQNLPKPIFTLDNYYSLQIDSVCDHNDFDYFDIYPTALESVMIPLLSK